MMGSVREASRMAARTASSPDSYTIAMPWPPFQLIYGTRPKGWERPRG